MVAAELAAGRTLDALIAEKVMGFQRVPVPKDCDGKNEGETLVPPDFQLSSYEWTPRGFYQLWAFCPHYSARIESAWEVVEHLRRQGAKVSVQNRTPGPWAMWICMRIGTDREQVTLERGETAALAICRAALAAVAPEAVV